jgi:hypothetical protein
MLNIINYLKKNTIIKPKLNRGNKINELKKVTPVNKEWYNSIYSFNKNYTKILPAVHDYAFKLLSRYFNMIEKQMILKNETYTDDKEKRASGRKV